MISQMMQKYTMRWLSADFQHDDAAHYFISHMALPLLDGSIISRVLR